MPKMVNLAIFLKTEACSQKELPERSISLRQKNDGKCQKLGDFQAMWFWFSKLEPRK